MYGYCRMISEKEGSEVQFRALFDSYASGQVSISVSAAFRAIQTIIGDDLLTQELFEAGCEARFQNMESFNYLQFKQLFLDIDYYLEHMEMPDPRRSRNRPSVRNLFSRRTRSERPSTLSRRVSVPCPKTPPDEPRTPL
jgi:hypothetical protein